MRTFSSIEELGIYIRDYINIYIAPTVISVSGYPGSGKSTVSNFLSEFLSIKHINLDFYLPANADSNVAWLDHVLEKRQEIHKNIPDGHSFILDGVMASKVAIEIVGKQNRLLSVYVKRLDGIYGSWDDSLNFLDNYMYQLNLKRPEYLSSVDRFHRMERPDLNSDLVIEVTH